MLHCRSTKLSGVSGRPTFRMHDTAAACPLFPVGEGQGEGNRVTAQHADSERSRSVELRQASGEAGAFVF